MLTAQARRIKEVTGQKAYNGEWDKLWKGNPNITNSTSGFPLKNCTGNRPYILGQTQERAIFSPNYHAEPGDIYLSNREVKEARELTKKIKDYIIVEPHTKLLFSKGNKDWGWDKWQTLVDRLQDHNLIQMIKASGIKKLNNLRIIETPPFRVAAAVLLKAKLLVCTDGALHHAAAASYYDFDQEYIGKGPKAIVIWGGFSHPKHLGYKTQVNIRANDTEPCGSKVVCEHCKAMMVGVPVGWVYDEISAALG